MMRFAIAVVIVGTAATSYAAVPESVTVPDGGTTLLILGVSIVGIEVLRRLLKKRSHMV